MAHYTYASGVATITISLRCPTCCALVPVPTSTIGKNLYPTLDELCCSPICKRTYYQKAYTVEKLAWSERKRLPSKVAQRLKRNGTLSTRANRYINSTL